MKQMQQRVEVVAEALSPGEQNIAGVSTINEQSIAADIVNEQSIAADIVSENIIITNSIQKAYGNTEKKGYTIIEFNKLSADELTIFDGVGEVTANAIVALRTERGGFASFDELLDVKGIGEAKLKKILGAP